MSTNYCEAESGSDISQQRATEIKNAENLREGRLAEDLDNVTLASMIDRLEEPISEIVNHDLVKKKKNVSENGKNSHVIEIVRKKEDRAKLDAYDCPDCSNWYEAFNLSEKALQERMKKCSRHRGTTGRLVRSSTPPGFWDPNMPSTPEAIEQGMMTVRNIEANGDGKKGSRKRKSVEPSEETSPLDSSIGQTSPLSSRKTKLACVDDVVLKKD